MPNLYLVSQSYKENSGSFSGFIEEVAKYFHTHNYKVTILCGKRNNNEDKLTVLHYADIIRFSQHKIPLFGNFFNALFLSSHIKKYFRLHKPGPNDLVLANGESALGCTEIKFALRAGDQPVKIYLNNMEIAKNEVSILTRAARFIHLSLLYSIEKSYFPKASAVIYSSDETRLLFEREYHMKKPYFIPHSGVNLEKLRNGKRLNLGGKIILFISAGNEKIRKGVIYLEKALPEIFNKYPDAKLLHVGDKFEWDVPQWCKKRIISVGRVPWDKMKDYYATADMLISCSLHEMFPNTIIEALAQGIPVVCSDIQGTNEYIKHKLDGFIFERGDIDGLKEGVYYFLRYQKRTESTKINQINQKKYLISLLSFMVKNNRNKPISINLLGK